MMLSERYIVSIPDDVYLLGMFFVYIVADTRAFSQRLTQGA